MQGTAPLYVILAVSFVVTLVIMWRLRMLRIEARIEVPPDDASSPISSAKLNSMPPPASWEVSDAVAEGGTLQPVRAGSLRPVRLPSQRPVTLTDGSSKLAAHMANDGPLPVPVRRSLGPASPRIVIVDDATALARASGLPVPLRGSARPPKDDER